MLGLSFQTELTEAGCDEAGRGCLAGPVVAAAVILPADFSNDKLNDSKQLSEKDRDMLRGIIEEQALAFAVVAVEPEEIDQINILNASIIGMQRACDQLEPAPEFIAVDGNRFKPYKDVPYECVIKGDGKYMNIAAASVLAKTYRDELMAELAIDYPEYGWEQNKGYPTQKHRAAIQAHGPTPHHRKSFQLLPSQLKLDL